MHAWIRKSKQHDRSPAAENAAVRLRSIRSGKPNSVRWRGRPEKLSGDAAARALADRDVRIAELKSQMALLTASHVAMIRAVGELGGFRKWAQFYESYSGPREQLA